MLHLLTNSFNYFTKRISGVIGITINNNHIDLIKLKGTGSSPRIVIAKRFEIDNSAFTKDGFHEESKEVLTQIGSLIGSAFTPIQIALPDPLFSIQRFDLDEIPNSKKTQNEYVHWNFSKQLNNEKLNCNSQLINSSSTSLLGIALDNLWITQTLEIFKKINLQPTVINSSSSYLLSGNLTIKAKTHNKAIVVINDDYWTLILTDTDNNIIYFNPQWDNDITTDTIISSCIRQIKSITNHNPIAQPTELFITDSKSSNQTYAIELKNAIHENSSVISLPRNYTNRTASPSFNLNPVNLASGILQ